MTDHPESIFAFRDNPAAPLKYIVAPGEQIRSGDLITLDQKSGKVRKFINGVDTGPAFSVPPGSRVTGDGFLEIPR